MSGEGVFIRYKYTYHVFFFGLAHTCCDYEHRRESIRSHYIQFIFVCVISTEPNSC